MNRFIRFIIIGLLGVLAIHQSICYAKSKTQNGITYNTWQTTDANYADLFILDAFNVGTSTAVYNDAGESANDSGAVNIAEFNEKIDIQIYIPTLGSTGIDVSVEGRFGTPTRWAEIYTRSFSAITTKDFVIPIASEKPKWFRVGAQATGTEGTDSITITVQCKEKRVAE